MKATIGTGAVRHSPQLLAVLPINSCVRGFQKNSFHPPVFPFSSSLDMVRVKVYLLRLAADRQIAEQTEMKCETAPYNGTPRALRQSVRP